MDLKSLDGLEAVVDGCNNLFTVYVSVKWNLKKQLFFLNIDEIDKFRLAYFMGVFISLIIWYKARFDLKII